MVVAQRKYEEISKVTCRPKRRKRTSRVNLLIKNRMAFVLMLAVVVSAVLSIYVSAYASYTKKGYDRSQLLSTLYEVKKENEVLHLRLEALRQPERVENYALANGMQPSKEMAYLESTDTQPHLAQNVERAYIR